jgi:hypothetical protein
MEKSLRNHVKNAVSAPDALTLVQFMNVRTKIIDITKVIGAWYGGIDKKFLSGLDAGKMYADTNYQNLRKDINSSVYNINGDLRSTYRELETFVGKDRITGNDLNFINSTLAKHFFALGIAVGSGITLFETFQSDVSPMPKPPVKIEPFVNPNETPKQRNDVNTNKNNNKDPVLLGFGVGGTPTSTDRLLPYSTDDLENPDKSNNMKYYIIGGVAIVAVGLIIYMSS